MSFSLSLSLILLLPLEKGLIKSINKLIDEPVRSGVLWIFTKKRPEEKEAPPQPIRMLSSLQSVRSLSI